MKQNPQKTKRKLTRKYWFTVEGENESWYLAWLQNTLNRSEKCRYRVIINSTVQQNPLKYSKTLNPLAVPEVTHLCDYESNEEHHVKRFRDVCQQLKESTGLGGRNFKYHLGYSNFTFELWILLHKEDFCEPVEHRYDYLRHINRAYNQRYARMGNYKSERNFKRMIGRLTLGDVITAIGRAREITTRNRERNMPSDVCCGYEFFTVNPSLSIWEPVECILTECGVLD